MKQVLLDQNKLTIDDVVAIARYGATVAITHVGEERVEKARKLLNKWVKEKKIIYGITTGYGGLCDTYISESDTRSLQKNLIMSHATGIGRPLPEDVVRAVMAIRLHDLAMGHSGCRVETLHYLQEFLNKGVTPLVPEKGSVGASGDLAPTAHLALVLLGMGQAFYKKEKIPGASALERINLTPLVLEAGEGVALINGTQVMTAIAVMVVSDSIRLSKMADIALGMSLEVLMGTSIQFDPRVHEARPHPGQIASADNILRLTKDSEITLSHKDCPRVQDAYSLRCSPQIHGASKDALATAVRVVDTEINSTTSNPLIYPDSEEILNGGNFHGQPIAMAADYLTIGIAELGNVSERRIERMVNPQLSDLPPFLVKNDGLNSGYMIAHYTAAALVSENKVLTHPACVDSIPTSANKEDHVSMGTIAIRQCREVLDNVEHVIAVEMICAAQAYDMITENNPLKAGVGTMEAYRLIREKIPYLSKDRIVSEDIEAMVTLLRSNKIVEAVERKVGKIKCAIPDDNE